MKRIQKLVSLIVVSLCLDGLFIQESRAKNVYNLKGTLSVLPPALQELSVLHGAIAFETGMVQRVYDIGSFSDLPDVPPSCVSEGLEDYEEVCQSTLSVELDKICRDMLNECDMLFTQYQTAFKNYESAILEFDVHPRETGKQKQVASALEDVNNASKKCKEAFAEGLKKIDSKNQPGYEKAIKKFKRVYELYEKSFQYYQSFVETYNKDLECYRANLENCAPVVKLARYFFYRVPRTTSIGDCKLSENFDAVNPVDFAEKIGQLVAAMWWYEWMLKQEFISPVNVKGALNRDVKTLIEKDPWLGSFSQSLILRSLDDEKWGKDMSVLVVLAALWCKCSDNRNALKKYNEALIGALKGKFEKFMQIEEMQNLGDRKEAYITTIREKFERNEAALNTKLKKLEKYEAVQPVVSALQKTLGEWQLDDVWGANSFDPANKKDLVQEVGTLTTEQLKKNNDVAATNYEKLVFASLLPLGKPRDIGYENNVNLNGKVFPDCMETVLRNFINNLAYDPERGIFSIAHLRSVTQKEPSEGITNFYTENSDPNCATDPSVHDAWAIVVSNLPWVVYACRDSAHILKMRFTSDISAEKRENCCKFYNTKYGNNFIDSSNNGDDLYDLDPNCRNFIIVIDQLLNLGLFEEECLADAVVRSDFVKKYLPMLVKKLQNLTLEVDEAELNAFDDNDWIQGNHNIFKIKKDKQPELPESFEYHMLFNLHISLHGQFETSTMAIPIDKVLTTISESDMGLLPGTLPMLLPYEAYKKMFKTGTQDVCAFFAHEVDNVDKVFDWLEPEETKIKSQFILDALLFLANKSPVGLDIMGVNGLLALRPLLVYRAVVNGGMESCYKAAMENIQKNWFWCVDSGHKQVVLSLFKALFNNDLGFDVAILVATDALLGCRVTIRSFGMNLFEALFKKDKGFQAAQELLNSKKMSHYYEEEFQKLLQKYRPTV